ncbi:tRNA-methyltransferase [Aquipluma nitroreducens]|uniref:tRNA (guanine-N(7)-)-methyltransferase n=1 Tax=Aquipluma nitroreducens TaxID=2010828 RepID=A0A5K7SB19_9BACT|nr:tRNA (guanosine(46)-N7)-methyltransferase TrmB [Aquipluma nitroreducens]BBE18494.1 tRNA-methyltransferase [Aquipluma nitroreducens]
MGKNKLSKFADLATYEHVVQVTYRHVQENGFQYKGKWSETFFGNTNPVILELGCGKGEYTVKLAKHYPEFNFIGLDIKGSRMWKGATQAKDQGLKNVGFLRTNIENIRMFFAENEVAEIWLTFPDPQMKRTRKRLTATNFISNYRQIMVSNGIIHLKSDSNFMYRYTEAMVAENQFEVIRQTDDLYHSEILDEVLSIQTFYEKQWLDRGLTIKYLAFRLSHQELLREPQVEIEKDPYRSFGRSAKE